MDSGAKRKHKHAHIRWTHTMDASNDQDTWTDPMDAHDGRMGWSEAHRQTRWTHMMDAKGMEISSGTRSLRA